MLLLYVGYQPKLYRFCLILIFAIILINIVSNIWYVALLAVVFWYILIYQKTYIKQMKWDICIAAIPALLYFVVREYCIFDLINNNFINTQITNFINRYDDTRVSSLIKLLIFSEKTDQFAWQIYHNSQELSIAYLLSIGGFQAVILKNIINFIFKKFKFRNVLTFIFILFYTYILSFSFGITRVMLMMLIKMVCKKMHRYNVWGVSGLITLILVPSSGMEIGFLLSYLCTLAVMTIYDLKISNKLLQLVIINIVCMLVSLPFVIRMNGVFSVIVLCLSPIMSGIYSATFVYYFFTWWIIWLEPIHVIVLQFYDFIFQCFSTINATIIINNFPIFVEIIYETIFIYALTKYFISRYENLNY